MKSNLVIFLVVVLSALKLSAQNHICRIADPRAVPRERILDFEKAIIDISIDPYQKKVEGSVTFTLKALRLEVDSFWLDGPGIQVDSAFLDGISIPFKLLKKGISFFPEKKLFREENHQLTVHYQATPKKGMYFTGWDDTSGKTPKQVWTQGQGIDNRHWFPHFDDLGDKLLTETIIRFDTGYSILSNGSLVNKKEFSGLQQVHYAMNKPHSSYLVMVAIGEYGADSVKSANGTEIRNWYYLNEPEKVEPTYRGTAELMNFLEEYTQVPYPWETYAQVPVHDFLYGAMENTTATIFSDKFYVDSIAFNSQNYVFVNAHEMAHQWFGNLVTARSVEAHWLHEGFATYLHGLWYKKYMGDEAGDLLFESFRTTALNAGKTDDYPIVDSRAGSSRHYMKGATVLRMLSDEIGEELFKETIKEFLTNYAYKNISTEDFLRTINDVTGHSLDEFFENWIFHGGEPTLQFQIRDSHNSNKGTYLAIKYDTNTTFRTYALTIPVIVASKKKVETLYFRLNGDTTLRLSDQRPEKLSYIEVDPERHLLINSTWIDYPNNWLENRSLSGITIFSRADAIDSLNGKDYKFNFEQIVNLETSDYVLSKAITADAKSLDDKSLIQLLKKTEHSKSKIAIIDTQFDRVLNTSGLIKHITIHEQNNDVIQQLLISCIKASVSIDHPELENLETRVENYPKLKLYHAQFLILNGMKIEGVQMLEGLTHPSIDFNVRIEAVSILVRLDYMSLSLSRNLYQGLTSFNRRLKSGFKQALNDSYLSDLDSFLREKNEVDLKEFFNKL